MRVAAAITVAMGQESRCKQAIAAQHMSDLHLVCK